MSFFKMLKDVIIEDGPLQPKFPWGRRIHPWKPIEISVSRDEYDDDDYEDELREEIQSEANSFLRTQGELLNNILKGVIDEFDPTSYWDLDSDDVSELKNIMDEGREQCIYENVRVMDRMTKTSLANATGQLSYRVWKIYLSRLYVTSDFDKMISQLEELQNERDEIAQILRSADKTLKSLDK